MSLFDKLKVNPQAKFGLGRAGDNLAQDLIKIEIYENRQAYMEFCHFVLSDHLSYASYIKNFTISSIDYCSALYDIVTAAEKDFTESFNRYREFARKNNLSYKTSNVMSETGGIIERYNKYKGYDVTSLLKYNGVETRSWDIPDIFITLKNKEPTAKSLTKPEVDEKFLKDVNPLMRDINLSFKLYYSKFINLNYAEKFGKSHPFYQGLLDHLAKEVPLKTEPLIKNLLKKYYEYDKSNEYAGDIDAWLNDQWIVLGRGRSWPHGLPYIYREIKIILEEEFNRVFALAKEDIDFRLNG